MENKKIVIANLKMNMTIDEVGDYLKVINPQINSKYVAICPSSLYVPYFLKNNYLVGLQNTYYYQSGAYTGEISPYQAHSMGVSLTILGHSERRLLFDETNLLISNKINDAIQAGLKVVLCIGESEKQREKKMTAKTLKFQLIECLGKIEVSMLKNIIVAYEPIWAIGTSLTPTNVEIEKTVSYIKEVAQIYLKYENMPVIYGGSVNDKNIDELNKISNLSGYLVGGASLDANKLLKIIEVAVK